jgi:hypothetical protein
MNAWEYLISSLPKFEAPTGSARSSAAVQALNGLGADGWEAVGMTVLVDDSVAVLLKRPTTGEYGHIGAPVGPSISASLRKRRRCFGADVTRPKVAAERLLLLSESYLERFDEGRSVLRGRVIAAALVDRDRPR